jgi:predicted O-methyltransferase YrrM
MTPAEEMEMMVEVFELPPYTLRAAGDTKDFSCHYFGAVMKHKPNTIVEIGTYRGATAIYMAAALKALGRGQLFTVDRRNFGNIPKRAFKFMGVDKHAAYICGVSENVAAKWAHGPIDMLHIDGDHEWEDIDTDYQSWRPHLAPYHVILCHDATADKFAVNEYIHKVIIPDGYKCEFIQGRFGLAICSR